MKLQIRVSISAIAAAVMLVSCASKAPVTSTGITSGGAGQGETSSDYRRLADNAKKEVVCRRQAVTSSRIAAVVCLTRAEIEEQRENASRVVRDIRDSEAISRSMRDRPPSVPSAPAGASPNTP
jgi:hypothetical protein